MHLTSSCAAMHRRRRGEPHLQRGTLLRHLNGHALRNVLGLVTCHLAFVHVARSRHGRIPMLCALLLVTRLLRLALLHRYELLLYLLLLTLHELLLIGLRRTRHLDRQLHRAWRSLPLRLELLLRLLRRLTLLNGLNEVPLHRLLLLLGHELLLRLTLHRLSLLLVLRRHFLRLPHLLGLSLTLNLLARNKLLLWWTLHLGRGRPRCLVLSSFTEPRLVCRQNLLRFLRFVRS